MSSGLHKHSYAPETARRMADVADRFLASLNDSQRRVANLPFAGDERFEWAYTPGPRGGLRLKDMTAEQGTAALRLLEAGLSTQGMRKAQEIMALETILRETERIEGVVTSAERDPELYYFTIFGDPNSGQPWGWRANGHHLALNFTVVGGELTSPTPFFFGANPAEVRHGPQRGLRTLPAEEDLGRALLTGLEPAQKAIAIVDPVAPSDIITRNYRTVNADAIPRGITFNGLNGEQRGQLVGLVRHYIDYTAHDLAENAWARIEQAGLDTITFAWAGGEMPGARHYYAVCGSGFIIEYDNTQNDGNHIHSVWRDLTNDWDLDLLAEHYAAAH